MRIPVIRWSIVGLVASACWYVSSATDARDARDEPRATVRIDAAKLAGTVSRYLTGVCIEDVNHEIYGGLYSQMLFGESFQEAPFQQPVKGFTAFEGVWTLKGDELHAAGGPGPKLVSDRAPFAKGTVSVEVYFADRAGGNAGLIVKTHAPGPGADNFDGYEVSLNPADRVLVLGRHRHNWEPIENVPCDVPIGEWIALSVTMTERSLEVTVNGKRLAAYEDRDHPLAPGSFGLRTWQRAARYRNLRVRTGNADEAVPFQPNPDDEGPVSGMWRPVRTGSAAGRYSLDTAQPFIGAQSQRITFAKGEGAVGIENRGLNRWGLAFESGKEYEGYVWVRADGPVELEARLESRDGRTTYARTALTVRGKDWQRLAFTLTSNASDDSGRFALALRSPGSAVVGHAFLQPGAWGRYQGLPLRKDVVEEMLDMGVTVVRYGGSMVNAPEYRWKKMLGPRDRRPPYKGFWYPHASNGWGILDFLDFCEAAGFLPIPAFNMDESPRDMADFVEYVNGPPTSTWGKKRVESGHPAPYRLKHLEFGNEERVDEKYAEKFRAVAEAVWAIDPEIVLVVGDFVYGRPIADPNHITGAASGITSLAGHRQILELAKKHNREVWFDIHIGTEHPGALGELAVVPTYVKALEALAAGAKHKVVIFELNSGNHAQRRALANAIAIGELQRLGDRLPIVCSANGLQPDGQNDNGWDQGLLFLDPRRVWLQPPGYVTRMISRSYRPVDVPVEVKGSSTLKVAAAKSDDGKSLVVRVVNAGDTPVPTRLSIEGFVPTKPEAAVEVLEGALDAVNTASDRERIVPRRSAWRHDFRNGVASYTFPARSFTVLVLE